MLFVCKYLTAQLPPQNSLSLTANQMDSSQPSKRQKLPLNLHLHNQLHETASDALTFPHSTNLTTFNQLLPPPHLMERRSGKVRVDDDAPGTLSLSLSSDRHNHLATDVDSNLDCHEQVWRSSVPLGPFTGYASILNRSRFLKPAQDLLDDLCGVDDSRLVRPNHLFLGFYDDDDDDMDLIHSADAATAGKTYKDSSLILLLDEVFKRYKQYYQHLQSVVASFEAVCGLENAAPYISFAFRTLAQQFSCLKKTLFERAQISGKEAIGSPNVSNVPLGRQDPNTICENLKPGLTSPAIQHPVWRSQRGLPAYAVAVFKNWLFEHFLHPYPSDTDKNLLAQQTGLSRNQVSNWFINARVRLWKPLVEEIHTLDEQQGQAVIKKDLQNSKATGYHYPPGTHSVDHQSRTVALQMSLGKQCHDRFNQSYAESSDYQSACVMKQAGKPEENMDISLALGLQQNDVNK